MIVVEVPDACIAVSICLHNALCSASVILIVCGVVVCSSFLATLERKCSRLDTLTTMWQDGDRVEHCAFLSFTISSNFNGGFETSLLVCALQSEYAAILEVSAAVSASFSRWDRSVARLRQNVASVAILLQAARCSRCKTLRRKGRCRR